VSVQAAADEKSLRSSDSGYTVQTDKFTVMRQPLPVATRLMWTKIWPWARRSTTYCH